MIPLIFWSTYFTGVFVFSVPVMRYAATIDVYCHQEGRTSVKYKWSTKNDCVKHCEPGCWRNDDRVTFDHAINGLWAFLWPFLLLPTLAWYVANRKPINSIPPDISARIDALEKENKMGSYNDLR